MGKGSRADQFALFDRRPSRWHAENRRVGEKFEDLLGRQIRPSGQCRLIDLSLPSRQSRPIRQIRSSRHLVSLGHADAAAVDHAPIERSHGNQHPLEVFSPRDSPRRVSALNQCPLEKTRGDEQEIRPRLNSVQEPERELLRGRVRHSLEEIIFEMRNRPRDAELDLIIEMSAAVNCAADRAALALLPIEDLTISSAAAAKT